MPSTITTSINVAANTQLFVLASSHASYLQQVSVSWSADGSSPLGTFEGTGEDVPMNLQNGSGNVLSVSTGNNTTLYAQFLFSSNGSNGPFQVPNVSSPIVFPIGTGSLTMVTSEDSTDNDDNDTTLVVLDL